MISTKVRFCRDSLFPGNWPQSRNAKLTLFSHSNSAHICLNSASVQDAGWMQSMMSMWMSLRTTQFLSLAAPDTSQTGKKESKPQIRKHSLATESKTILMANKKYFLTNVAKYNAILSRSHLHIGLDVSKIVRSQSQR